MQGLKPVLMVVCLMAMVAPWLTGGRDMAALVIDLAAALIAAFLLWTSPTARLRRDWVNCASGLFLVWTALSLVWSVNRYQTLLSLIPLLCVGAGYVLGRYLNTLGWPLRWLVVAYGLVATVASSYGIYLYLTASYDRLTSSFYWPNPFAAYLLPVIILSGWWVARHRSWWPGRAADVWLALVAFLINGCAFLLTASRGATLVLVVVSILALALSRLGWRFWIKIVCIAAMAFGLSLGVSFVRNYLFHHTVTSAVTRVAQVAQEEGTTDVSDRWNFLRSAVDIWQTQPVWGTGAGTYATMHPQYQIRVISAGASTHNYYAQTLSELGLVGVLLLAVVAVGWLWRAWQGWRAGLIGGGVMLVALAALMIHFGLDIDSRYPALFILLGVIAGLAAARSMATATAAPSPRRYGWLLAALVVLIPVVLSLYYTDLSFADGVAYQNDGNYEAAAASFKQSHQALAYNPDNWTAEGIIYYILAARGQDAAANLTLARDRALEAMRQDPHDAQHVFLLARIDRLAGDLKGAEQAYHRALELDPYNHPMYYADLVDLYLSVGQYNNAALYANRALQLYPDSVVANRSAEVEVPPEVARLSVERATLELKNHNRVAARADLQRALRLDPGNAAARALLAQP